MKRKDKPHRVLFADLSKEEQNFWKYVGYASEYFSFNDRNKAIAKFRRKFGYNPRDYKVC